MPEPSGPAAVRRQSETKEFAQAVSLSISSLARQLRTFGELDSSIPSKDKRRACVLTKAHRPKGG